MDIVHVVEAYDLARMVLDEFLKSHLKDARILGQGKERKLCFFFDDTFMIEQFEKKKEEILKSLRVEYRKKFSLYQRIDFVFHAIEARNIRQSKIRSKEEQEVLERGLAKLEKIVKSIRAKRKQGLVS